MSLQLSARDLRLFGDAFRSLLTPLQPDDGEPWARSVCRSVRALAAVDSVTSVDQSAHRPKFVSEGVSEDALTKYAASWHHRIPGDVRRLARRLTAWVREDSWPAREAMRTVYYNEFCVHAGNCDSAGMGVMNGDHDLMVIYLGSKRPGRFLPAGREFQMLQLLQPALSAGVSLLNQVSTPAAMFAAVDAPIGMFDMRGRLIHATREFVAIVNDASHGHTIWSAARWLASQLGQTLPTRTRRRTGDFPPICDWRSDDGRVTLRATLYEPDNLPLGPLCVITATTKTPRTMSIDAMRRRFSLTAREADVASLLGQGLRNREIARRLSISEHTVRHHTERVLSKLGAASRTQVAILLALRAQ